MADLLSRPLRRSGNRRGDRPGERDGQPLTVLGVLAAVQSAGLGVLAVMVVVLVGWATTADSGASAPTAVAAALQVWLVAHHAAVAIPEGSFALTPLGLTAVPVALLHTATTRAGRAAPLTSWHAVLALAGAATATYAVTATLVALLARTGDVRPQPLSAFLGAGVLAALAAGSGALRASGRWTVLWHRLPDPVRAAAPPAAAAIAVLAAGGAVLVGGSLLLHRDRAGLLLGSLDAGTGGSTLLLLGSLAYVPTAIVWGMSYAAGPGFAVGTGTSVTPFGADLGAVPGIPLLAALPADPGSSAGAGSLALPMLAGVVAALLLHRSPGRPATWRSLGERSGIVGGLTGLAVGTLCMIAAGPVGPGRMGDTGPDWWAVGPVVALEVAVVVAVTSAVLRRRG